jgi:hypothetical protein
VNWHVQVYPFIECVVNFSFCDSIVLWQFCSHRWLSENCCWYSSLHAYNLSVIMDRRSEGHMVMPPVGSGGNTHGGMIMGTLLGLFTSLSCHLNSSLPHSQCNFTFSLMAKVCTNKLPFIRLNCYKQSAPSNLLFIINSSRINRALMHGIYGL